MLTFEDFISVLAMAGVMGYALARLILYWLKRYW